MNTKTMQIPPLPDGLNPRKRIFRLDMRESIVAVIFVVLLLVGNFLDFSSIGVGSDRLFGIVVLASFAMIFSLYNYTRWKSVKMQYHLEKKLALFAMQYSSQVRSKANSADTATVESDEISIKADKDVEAKSSKFAG